MRPIWKPLVLSLVFAGSIGLGFRMNDVTHHTMMAAVDTTASTPIAALAAETAAPVAYESTAAVQRGIRVALGESESALLVNATLDHQETVSFILDTGATYTTISREMALKLGYDLEKADKVTITTANGQVVLPKITLKSLTLNGYTAHNVVATVMPMPRNVSFSGLIGLSFIRRHRITIDPAAQQLVIQPEKAS